MKKRYIKKLFRDYLGIAMGSISLFGLLSCSNIREGETTIINTNIYETAVSLHYSITKDSSITKTFIMAPGSSLKLNVKLFNIDPTFYIHQEPTLRAMDFLLWLERGDKQNVLEPESYASYPIRGFTIHSSPSKEEKAKGLFGDEENKELLEILSENKYGFNTFPVSDNIGDPEPVFLSSRKVTDSGQKLKYVAFKKSEFKDSFGRISGQILIRDVYDFTPNANKTSASKVQKEVHSILEKLNEEYIKKGVFEVVNAAPYSVQIALWFQESRSTSKTNGWYILAPGERRSFERYFNGVIPNFAVYGESRVNEANIIRNAFNLPHSHPGIRYFQPEGSEVVLSAWINEPDSFDLQSVFNELVLKDIGVEVAFNLPVVGRQDLAGKSYSASFLIQDFNFPFVITNASSNTDSKEEILNSYIENAQCLAKSLRRQVEYDRRFSNFRNDSPYLLGLFLKDQDVKYPGVVVDGLMFNQNILGQPLPFRKEDIIVELNDQLVFSRKDIVVITNNHARDIKKGISIPLKFTLVRDGSIYEGETLYFYNKEYKGWPSNDWFRAFLGGVIDAVTLGFDHKIYKSLSNEPEKAHAYIENKFRLQQFHKGYFLAGNLGVALFSPAGLALKGPLKNFLKRGVGKKLGGILATTIVEGVENALWTFGNNHVLYSKNEFSQMLKKNIKFGAGFGMAFASFSLIK
ncbi:hypothetical protein [uncultured Croceitalea sp.]|uniref:hypothetical protein n=1 Tax=uncultured Croceitalea sp. TaxID=1798908 RepID=UPI003305B2E1